MIQRKDQNDWLTHAVNDAFREVEKEVVRRARQTRTPIIVWDNGAICAVPSESWENFKANRRAAESSSPDV